MSYIIYVIYVIYDIYYTYTYIYITNFSIPFLSNSLFRNIYEILDEFHLNQGMGLGMATSTGVFL